MCVNPLTDPGLAARNFSKLVECVAVGIPEQVGPARVGDATIDTTWRVRSSQNPRTHYTVELKTEWVGLQAATCTCPAGAGKVFQVGQPHPAACKHVLGCRFCSLDLRARMDVLAASPLLALAWAQGHHVDLTCTYAALGGAAGQVARDWLAAHFPVAQRTFLPALVADLRHTERQRALLFAVPGFEDLGTGGSDTPYGSEAEADWFLPGEPPDDQPWPPLEEAALAALDDFVSAAEARQAGTVIGLQAARAPRRRDH